MTTSELQRAAERSARMSPKLASALAFYDLADLLRRDPRPDEPEARALILEMARAARSGAQR